MCYKLESVRDVLKACGIRCKNFKNLLREQAGTCIDGILDKIYFTASPEKNAQRKAVIYGYGRDILQGENIVIVVLYNGSGNKDLMNAARENPSFEDWVENEPLVQARSTYGRIQISFIKYSQCLCDECIERYIGRESSFLNYRLAVFDNFFVSIPVSVGTSLVDQSLKAVLRGQEESCCEATESFHLWRSSVENWLIPTCKQYPTCKETDWESVPTWDELDWGEAYLVIGVSLLGGLILHSRLGYNIQVLNYPRDIGIIRHCYSLYWTLFVARSTNCMSFDYGIYCGDGWIERSFYNDDHLLYRWMRIPKGF